MTIIKCKMCGGDIELSLDRTIGTCEYCGTQMTLPKVSDEQRAALFNRGNHFRRTGDFDKALAIYENIVREDETDAEAHWCCALCRFGIEYVEDPATYEYLPTCHRASFDSFLEDVDYLAAVEYSDGVTRRQYQRDAAKIAEVQRGILATSQKEEPFDVFICYKESDDETKERTRDSIDAQEIYYQLTEKGYRVFFSRVTLEDKAGTEYEPYIFAALNSAKVMVVVGSKPEYFSAVWVKNEWSRYLSLMKKDRSRLLLPCYKNMDPYDLPEQLSVLQSYDMAKIGFMQDLVRGIKKILEMDKPKEVEPVVVQAATGNTNLTAQLKRGQIALEDGDWEAAVGYFDKALDLDAECAEAYFGKALAAAKCATGEAYAQMRLRILDRSISETLVACEQDTERIEAAVKQYEIPGYLNAGSIRRYYSNDARTYESETKWLREQIQNEAEYWERHKLIGRAMRYARGDYAATLQGLLECTTNELKNRLAQSEEQDRQNAEAVCKRYAEEMDKADRNAIAAFEEAQQKRRADYESYCKVQEQAKTEREFEDAAKSFLLSGMRGYEDCDERAKQCTEKAEECRKNEEENRKLEEEREKKRIAAIVAALKTGDKAKKEPTLVEKHAESKARIESLTELLNRFDALHAHATQLQKEQTEIEKQEETLSAQRSKLGIFAGKEKKRINEELTALAAKKQELADQISRNAQQCLGYTSKQDIGRAIAEERAASSDIEAQIKSGRANSNIVYSYEGAVKAYLSDQETTRAVNAALYPAAFPDSVFFGRYVQKENSAPEPIEWQVLARGIGRMLLISKYALDCQQYNATLTDVTWEKSSLRKWLNSRFISKAFNAAERAMIRSESVSADENPNYSTSPGKSTTDQVFLLSISEAKKYFHSQSDLKCQGTSYCSALNTFDDSDGFFFWWLRSPGGAPECAAYIDFNGGIDFFGDDVIDEDGAVRPALWVRLERLD